MALKDIVQLKKN